MKAERDPGDRCFDGACGLFWFRRHVRVLQREEPLRRIPAKYAGSGIDPDNFLCLLIDEQDRICGRFKKSSKAPLTRAYRFLPFPAFCDVPNGPDQSEQRPCIVKIRTV